MPNQNNNARVIINPDNDPLPKLYEKQRERKAIEEKKQQKERLEHSVLANTETMQVRDILDYDTIKKQRNILFIIAAAELIAGLILLFRCK